MFDNDLQLEWLKLNTSKLTAEGKSYELFYEQQPAVIGKSKFIFR
jgi:hypothetical protein